MRHSDRPVRNHRREIADHCAGQFARAAGADRAVTSGHANCRPLSADPSLDLRRKRALRGRPRHATLQIGFEYRLVALDLEHVEEIYARA